MISPIYGYKVECDRCGKRVLFYDNPDFKSKKSIDYDFAGFVVELEGRGWKITEHEVLCPECAVKAGRG